MSRTLTPPMARVPVGLATINGQQIEVRQHPEFVRFFFDLFDRVGSTEALSNSELEALAQALTDAGAIPASSPEAQEAARGVEELRQALASLRGDIDSLRGELQALRDDMPSLPSFQPLESRVQQIEDRLQ
jgi:TolA-binding protein